MNIQHRPIAKSEQKIRTCTELRQQIHDDLRTQHPEWIQPNGESPMCDTYEARLMEELDSLMRAWKALKDEHSTSVNREV